MEEHVWDAIAKVAENRCVGGLGPDVPELRALPEYVVWDWPGAWRLTAKGEELYEQIKSVAAKADGERAKEERPRPNLICLPGGSTASNDGQEAQPGWMEPARDQAHLVEQLAEGIRVGGIRGLAVVVATSEGNVVVKAAVPGEGFHSILGLWRMGGLLLERMVK